MAQTGFTPISNYYSATASTAPTAGNLVAGELAINTADGKIFYKDSSGAVQTIASKSATAGTYSSITTSNLTIGTTQLGAGNATLLKNRLIDAGFIINQRGYVSGTALSAGTYAHDRWKAGASGCTYTFTQGSLGVPIVITITAGSLQQIIEGCNMPDGGTFTLSWTGTAQGRVNGGGYSTSPLIVTGLTAGTNCTVEFNTGTCSFPQLEVGSSATGFEYRQYQQELALCQRYYELVDGIYSTNNTGASNRVDVTNFVWKQTKRAAPTIAIVLALVNTGTNNFSAGGGANAIQSFYISGDGMFAGIISGSAEL